MIGSAGRNIGKTELACSLIRRFGGDHDIVGLKVTTIDHKDGTCPRGSRGCGVCSSLKGDYCITEETGLPSGKDTSRLLASGAGRVFWMRVMRSHLEEGAKALLDSVGCNAVSICESNSFRQALEPGLFLMVKDRNSNEYKASAEAVMEYVDRTVLFDGSGLDIDLNDISFAQGQWNLREHATAIVMAGGDSRRMKQDKRFLLINGRPMIEHVCYQLRYQFDQILVSTNDLDNMQLQGVDIVCDRIAGQGPLMGIASALEASSHDLNLVVACDIPEIDITFARRMLSQAEGYDAVVAMSGESRVEPLFAVYRKRMLKKMQELLSSGERRIKPVFDLCKVRYIDVPASKPLVNINTMEDYKSYLP